MKILYYDHVEPKDAGAESSKVSVRWLITEGMGAKNFAMRLFEIESGVIRLYMFMIGSMKFSF